MKVCIFLKRKYVEMGVIIYSPPWKGDRLEPGYITAFRVDVHGEPMRVLLQIKRNKSEISILKYAKIEI